MCSFPRTLLESKCVDVGITISQLRDRDRIGIRFVTFSCAAQSYMGSTGHSGQARNRAAVSGFKRKSGPRMFVGSALATCTTEHMRLGGGRPGLGFSSRDLSSAKVPVMRLKRKWAGDRRGHCNAHAAYWRDVCRQWRLVAGPAGKAGASESKSAEVAGRTRKRRRIQRTNDTAGRGTKLSWSRWRRFAARARVAWRSDPALRATWRARSADNRTDRVCDTPSRQELAISDTLWGTGSHRSPLRLDVLEEFVTDAVGTRRAPVPGDHPHSGGLAGPTRLARSLIEEQDATSAVEDPAEPGSKLKPLVSRATCADQHPGLCRSAHAEVFATATHVQANINTVLDGCLALTVGLGCCLATVLA